MTIDRPPLQSLIQIIDQIHQTMPTGKDQTQQSKEAHIQSILDAFKGNWNQLWKGSKNYQEEIIQDNVLTRHPLKPYYEVFQTIRELAHTERAAKQTSTTHPPDWPQAIHHAIHLYHLQEPAGTSEKPHLYNRQLNVALAAKKLQDRGYALNRHYHFLFLEPTAETRLYKDIESLVKAIGGLKIAQCIFRHIEKAYDPVQERYHLVYGSSMFEMQSPHLPLHYLLMLAAKHPFPKKPYRRDPNLLKKLIDLATDYTTLMDVQYYGNLPWATLNAEEAIELARHLSLYQNLCKLPQQRGSDIPVILQGCLQWLDPTKPHGRGWTIQQAITLINTILQHTTSVRGPVYLNTRDLHVQSQLPSHIAKIILEDVLSHPIKQANATFIKPSDFSINVHDYPKEVQINFYKKPLLNMGNDQFLLLDRSLSSTAYYHALTNALFDEEKTDNFNDQIGRAVERWLRQHLSALGQTVHWGEYRAGGKDGDLDMAVETPNYLYLFEIKRKALTPPATVGSDLRILIDLMRSLVKAQTQLGRQEIALRKNGSITLKNDTGQSTLELRGRKIRRIALTLHDFGVFQDRIFIAKFLEANFNVQYRTDIPEFANEMTEFNQLLQNLITQTLELNPETELRAPFHHCSFMSIPQLLITLDGVSTPDSFEQRFNRGSGVTFNTLDFYYEYKKMTETPTAQ